MTNSRAVPVDRDYMTIRDANSARRHMRVTSIEPENTGDTSQFTYIKTIKENDD